MGYASKGKAITETVDLSNGYQAHIGLLSKADNDAVRAALLGGNKTNGKYEAVDGSAGKTVVDQTMDDSAYTRTLLSRGIKSWTLDDDDDQPLPITEKTVEILFGPDADVLVKRIKALNAPVTKEDKSTPQPADAVSA